MFFSCHLSFFYINFFFTSIYFIRTLYLKIVVLKFGLQEKHQAWLVAVGWKWGRNVLVVSWLIQIDKKKKIFNSKFIKGLFVWATEYYLGDYFFFYFGISAVHKIWKWAGELCIYFLFCKILAKKRKRVQLGIILTVNIWLWISPWSRPMARRGTEKLCGSNPLKRELAWHLQQMLVLFKILGRDFF